MHTVLQAERAIINSLQNQVFRVGEWINECAIWRVENHILLVVFPQEKRLRGRQTETEVTLQRRLNIAKGDMEYGKTTRTLFITIIYIQ